MESMMKTVVKAAAKETAKQLLKGLLSFFGLPTLAIVFLLLVIMLGYYGALVVGDVDANGVIDAQDQAIKGVYVDAAERSYSIDSMSDGSLEERHKTQWGLIYAVDTMFSTNLKADGNRAYDIAEDLRPKFKYKNSTVRVVVETKTKDGVEREEKEFEVKLLTEANTFRGIYRYDYKKETIVTHPDKNTTITTTKEVLNSTSYQEDWGRFDKALTDFCNIKNPDKVDRAMLLQAGIAFTSGRESLAWLLGPIDGTGIPSGGYIPTELMALFKAAGDKYGVPWYILAAIAKIESDFRPDIVGPPNYTGELAQGMMQFLPSTWRKVGQDGNGDGIKNPFDPADAIHSAAYYLILEGWQDNPRNALYAYNHSWQYVDSVMALAEQYQREGMALLTDGYPWPVAGNAWRISSYFGERESVRDYRQHTGLDIAAAAGTPVIAVVDGTVIKVSTTGAGGNAITLQGDDGRVYYYAHLSEFLIQNGQTVKRSQVIGKVGSTGNSTGPHLHFGVMIGTKWVDPLSLFQN